MLSASSVAGLCGILASLASAAVLGLAPAPAASATPSVEVALADAPWVEHSSTTEALYDVTFDVTNTTEQAVPGAVFVLAKDPAAPAEWGVMSIFFKSTPCNGQVVTPSPSKQCALGDLAPGATVRVAAQLVGPLQGGAHVTASVLVDGVMVSNELGFGVGQVPPTGSNPGPLVAVAITALVAGGAARRLARRS